MRRKVPFIGEEHMARAGDNESEAKKARGRLIDDVLSTSMQSSSWEDIVPSEYPNPIAPFTKPPRAHASVPNRPARVPMSPGPALKKAIIESRMSAANGTTASIDWLPINNGHGLRINIAGNLDQGIRDEWRRLLDETADNGIGQFEFNLNQAPSLSLTGLGMLLLFKEQKGSERGDIKLCNCNKEVWQILQWTGMDKYFTIQGTPNMDN